MQSHDEYLRQDARLRYGILDSEAEPAVDDPCQLGAQICGAPMAYTGFMGHPPLWFKTHVGISQTELLRDRARGGHTSGQSHPIVLPNAFADLRSANHLHVAVHLPPTAVHAAGMCQSLSKPIRSSALLEIVYSALTGIPKIYLIQSRATAPLTASLEIPHTTPRSSASGRILLVEDLEDNRDLIALFLKNTAYELDMAENGAIAVEKFKAYTYDLVFMDLQMPVMDGYEATGLIRAWEKEQTRTPTPVLALTANTLAEAHEKSLAAGCTAYLTKPLKKKTLLTAIVDYTGRPLDETA